MSRKTRVILGIVVICLVVLVGAVSALLVDNQPGSQPPTITELPTVPKSPDAIQPSVGPALSSETTPLAGGELIKLRSNVLVEVYRPVGGTMVQVYRHESSNVITNIGLHVIPRTLTGQAATYQWTAALGGNDLWYTVGTLIRIALSTDSTAVDATHSSWQTVDGSYPSNIEIITGGLTRSTTSTYTQSSYTAGSGATKGSFTYASATTFTVTAGNSFTGVQKAGLFNGVYNTNAGAATGSSISSLVAENTFTPVDLNAGDQIAITWRITL